jgi:hypothetical protein
MRDWRLCGVSSRASITACIRPIGPEPERAIAAVRGLSRHLVRPQPR